MSPLIRRPILRRRVRGVARRARRRALLRPRRRIFRRTRRLVFRTGVLLLIGGTAAAIKLSQRDVQRVEVHTSKSAEDLSESELLDAMKKLGIQKLELTAEDEAAIGEADAK